jgi:hypothetical protein
MVLKFVRYGIPAVLALTGVLFLSFGSDDVRYEMFGMCMGAALSLLLFTFLFRIGVSGEREREEEEDARRYLAEHGHWPDEKPRRQA